jgi:hypothetical protein
MQEMNYGCGSTISAQDLINNPKIICRSWGGMELLQFSYFSRQKGVVGRRCRRNARSFTPKFYNRRENDWFKSEFVELKKRWCLPIEDESIDIAAQNCLFNIFKTDDLKKHCKKCIVC